MEQDWELSKIREGWSLTNTSGKIARDVYIEFEGVMNGRPWREGVTPIRGLDAIGEFQPYQTVRINIDSPRDRLQGARALEVLAPYEYLGEERVSPCCASSPLSA